MKKITLSLSLLFFNLISCFGQIPNYVPTNSLIGWWPFNGNALDESGNGLNGIVNGGLLASDRFGASNKAYNFSGNGQGIILPSPAIGTFSDSVMAYSLWFNESNSATEFLHIFKACGKSLMHNIPIGELRAYDGNSFHVAGNNNVLFQDGWRHVFVQYDHQLISIYLNGQLLASATTGFSFPVQYESLTSEVGTSNGGQYPYDGLVDDVAIWNRILTSQEIIDLYNSSTNGMSELSNLNKKLLKITDLSGKEIQRSNNMMMLFQYSDGSIERVYDLGE
jgi:hypothetical protein